MESLSAQNIMIFVMTYRARVSFQTVTISTT